MNGTAGLSPPDPASAAPPQPASTLGRIGWGLANGINNHAMTQGKRQASSEKPSLSICVKSISAPRRRVQVSTF
jgi:hypothetical protein